MCLAAAALFGASTPASKAILDSLGPFTLAGLLYLGAAIGMLPFALRGRSLIKQIDRRNLKLLAGAVVFGGIVGPVLLLTGLRIASASSVALWLNMETTATIILGFFLFKENMDARSWLAAALVVGASILLASPSGFGGLGASLLIVGACVAWGFDNNFTALIDGLTPSQSTVAKGVVAGSVNLVIGLSVEAAGATSVTVLAALGVGTLAYGASIALYIAGAQQLGATRSQMIFATAPFWGVALAWTALSEPVLLVQLIAGALMITAVWLMHSERHGHRHTHERQTHTHWHRHDDGHHDHEHPGLPRSTGHSHEHTHEPMTHEHPHKPDLHHRHKH
jgi:drug/metabolite transporter (DMT)-like permease